MTLSISGSHELLLHVQYQLIGRNSVKDFGAVFDSKRQVRLSEEQQKADEARAKRDADNQKRAELMAGINEHVRPVLLAAKEQLASRKIRVEITEGRSEPELKFWLQFEHRRPTDTFTFRGYPKRINCSRTPYGAQHNHGGMAAQIELEAKSDDEVRSQVEGVMDLAIAQAARS